MSDETSAELDVKTRLVQATVSLLAEEGPQALQVLKVAERSGVSSMAVYSRFGGMPQLVDAVVDEGFRMLGARFERVDETDDPVSDMSRLALEYYDSALGNPHLFDLMFGLSTPGGYRQSVKPPQSSTVDGGRLSGSAYWPLVKQASRAISAGRFRDDDPHRLAAEIWSAVHGFTALAIGGYFSHLDAPLPGGFVRLATHIAVGLGDTLDEATRSATAAVSREPG